MVRLRRSQPAIWRACGVPESSRTSTRSCSSTSRRRDPWSRWRTAARGRSSGRRTRSTRAYSGGEPRRDPPRRSRAELPLADLQRADRRAGERARRRARRDARCSGRRRAAHASGARDGRGHRSATGGRARSPALALRRADRHRGGAARLVPAGGDPVREPLGGGASLRAAGAESACGNGAVRASRRRSRDGDRRERAGRGFRRVRRAGLAGGRDGCGHGGLRRGARTSSRLAGAARRVGRSPVRRRARGRDHAVPAGS